jgi:hypothetical protein
MLKVKFLPLNKKLHQIKYSASENRNKDPLKQVRHQVFAIQKIKKHAKRQEQHKYLYGNSFVR